MSTAARGGVPTQGQAGPDPAADTDPLLHPDPAVAADCAATESLLRCWVRETGITGPPGNLLTVALGDGLHLVVPVRYWSPCGWHRFGRARTEQGTVTPRQLAVLMARAEGSPVSSGSSAPWLVFCPGAAILLLALSFNLVGDALRDAFDPTGRGRGG